jgi:hypothetical protein
VNHIDPLDLTVAHARAEMQHGTAVALELGNVAEVLEGSEENRQERCDRLLPLERMEGHRAMQHHVGRQRRDRAVQIAHLYRLPERERHVSLRCWSERPWPERIHRR